VQHWQKTKFVIRLNYYRYHRILAVLFIVVDKRKVVKIKNRVRQFIVRCSLYNIKAVLENINSGVEKYLFSP